MWVWVWGEGRAASGRKLWTCRCTKHAAMTVYSVFLKDCILLRRCLTTSRACSPKTARARCTPQNSTTTWPSAASSLPPDPTAASVRPGAADTLCMHTNQPPSSSCTQPSTTSPASRRCGSTSTRASRSLHAIPGNETRALKGLNVKP